MVKDFSDSKRGTLLPPLHVLLFSISTKGFSAFVNPVVVLWLERYIA